ncbi:MAG: radical SAM family heme chaperone HemW [Candidatus Competibacteraceae bacterium]|nr:radical SAM family heme chaperone HemW [Candidatus Competibacteraceae bacterium]
MELGSVPLALYIHIPWCVRKCPYCDFNSHPLRDSLPERAYIDALLADLDHDLPGVQNRTIESIFIGGGTPSLFSAEAIGRLLTGLSARLTLAEDVEVTLEANPGTVEQDKFSEFRAAGINRLSIGVQSFHPEHLQLLGRIHSREEAWRAAETAHQAGFDNFNLDLMFGLPTQTPAQALADVITAIALEPTHISYYQLTLEPNTLFHKYPPTLPDDDRVWQIQEQGQAELAEQGYAQYEISAYARPGRRCRHNLNYWTFGDYLGIGAGAHGKLSDLTTGAITRLAKTKHPATYLRHSEDSTAVTDIRFLQQAELPLEFMLNAARLLDGVPARLFCERTGLPLQALEPQLTQARTRGLLEPGLERLQPTALGWRFLNELLESFVPE